MSRGAGPAHLIDQRRGQPDGAEEVQAHDTFVVVQALRGLLKGASDRAARVVDHDVDPAVPSDHPIDQLLHLGFIAEVARAGDDGSVAAGGSVGQFVEQVRAARDGQHGGTRLGQPQRDTASDARGRAGHQDASAGDTVPQLIGGRPAPEPSANPADLPRPVGLQKCIGDPIQGCGSDPIHIS